MAPRRRLREIDSLSQSQSVNLTFCAPSAPAVHHIKIGQKKNSHRSRHDSLSAVDRLSQSQTDSNCVTGAAVRGRRLLAVDDLSITVTNNRGVTNFLKFKKKKKTLHFNAGDNNVYPEAVDSAL